MTTLITTATDAASAAIPSADTDGDADADTAVAAASAAVATAVAQHWQAAGQSLARVDAHLAWGDLEPAA